MRANAVADTCVVVAQVGFGSGFKCNSAVWKATRNIHDSRHAAWAHLKKAGNLEKAWQYVQVGATPVPQQMLPGQRAILVIKSRRERRTRGGCLLMVY